MSSLRRILSSRANGALSRGPKTAEGKQRSATNSVRHGLLSDCVVLPGESRDAFEALLAQQLERLEPLDGNHLPAEGLATQPDCDNVARIAAAFRQLSPELALLHRYEARRHLMYQRALHNLLLLRTPGAPNEPNPISGQSGPIEVPIQRLPEQSSSNAPALPCPRPPGSQPEAVKTRLATITRGII